MGALSQQLDSYSRLGIPKLQHCKVKFEAEDAVEEGMCKTKYLNPNYTKTIKQIISFKMHQNSYLFKIRFQ